MNNTDPVVVLSGLTHDYGEVVALQEVSLQIPSGVTGLVGANGAGWRWNYPQSPSG